MANVTVAGKRIVNVDTPSNTRPPNVVVGSQKNISVGGGTVGLVTTNPGNILSNPTMSTRLDRLRDVDATNQVEGSTLIYDVASGKYVLSYVDLKYVKGSLEGGTF